MRTPLTDHMLSDEYLERSWRSLNAEQQKFYGRQFFEAARDFMRNYMRSVAGDPIDVVLAMEEVRNVRQLHCTNAKARFCKTLF